MKKTIIERLERLNKRFVELAELLSDTEIINNQDLYRKYSKEYAEIEPIMNCYHDYNQACRDREEALIWKRDNDQELILLAEETLEELTPQITDLEQQLHLLLLPEDVHDRRNVFLEVRAGTGGNEAALFAGDLFRMYCRYVEMRKWQIEILNQHVAEVGGYREIVARIIGDMVYARLKFESGVHRVQRVPVTESQGRIHTSACTIAIIAEPEPQEEVEIRNDELRIDTFRSSGAGGQHVNTTDSAVRITHLPTGIVVECQDERSQHKNKAKAMSFLQARISNALREEQRKNLAEQRKSLVGSGDRSERIRTYNFPQGRVTDHRIGLTLYKLPEILAGNLDSIIEPLMQEYKTELLSGILNE